MSINYNTLAKRLIWFSEKVSSLPCTKLDWTVKGVIHGIIREFTSKGADLLTLTKVWYQNIMDYTGLSMDAVVKSIAKLVKCKALIKEERREKSQDGTKKRRIYLCFTSIFYNNPASLLELIEDSNHGGSRTKRHKDCGGEIVNLCVKCGQTHIDESETYYDETTDEPTGDISALPSMAELDSYETHVDAANIPDYLIDIHGDAVLTMDTKDLQKASKLTRLEYEGVDEDDLDNVFEASKGWHKVEEKEGKKKR